MSAKYVHIIVRLQYSGESTTIEDGHLFVEACACQGTKSRLPCSCKQLDLLQAVKNDGQTALHEAAEAGQKEAVEYLLSVGANTQAQDEVRATLPTLCFAGWGSLMSGGETALPRDKSHSIMSLPIALQRWHLMLAVHSGPQATMQVSNMCVDIPEPTISAKASLG